MDFNLTSDAVKKDAEILISLDKFGIDRITPWIPELQHQILSAQGAFSGEIRMRYDKNTAALTDYKIVLNSDKGGVQFLDAPQSLVYDNFALLMTQNGLKFTGNLQGRAITLNTTENISKIGGYTIDLHIPALAIADIAGLMKEGRDSVAQEWLTEKLKNGTMSNINVTGHVHRDKNKEWTMSNLVADLDVDNMWILYKHDLAPADAVTAHAHYEGDKLSLLFEKGSVSGMNIIEGHLDFADLTKAGAGDCKGLLRLKGSLQNVLSYLDNPLIRYKERVAVDLSKATGNVQMSLGLDFPTTKDVAAELIKVDVDAILRNASMPDIINGVTISGGPLALKGNANDIIIRGDAMLNGTPSHMTYQTYFDPKTAPFTQKLDLKGSIDATTLAGFGLDSWARDVKSPSKYTISYNQSIGKKPVLNLAISGSDLSVTTASIGLAQNNRFESANLDGLVLGKTRGNMNVIHNKNNGYDIVFNGAMFDARPVLSSSDTKKKKNSPAFLNATINAGSMILSDKGTLDNTKLIYASNARGDVAKLDLSGDIGGNKTVISFNETTRGDTLNVDIANAGAFLSAMDLTQGVKGGSVQINANPNGEYGSMKGDARMTGFTARDVPFLGRIINALSLPGLLQLFTNEGIAFERLSTGFTWSKSDNVSMLRLDNGKTAGSSLGLTFEGAYNHTNKTLDIKGKVVPLSEINNIVKSIPLLGPLISGGKNGALVAASYTMRGPVKDPNVFINPLSILTPGLLRTILFDGATTPPAETNK